MNRAIFDTYIETQLAPCLAPGDVVILDNLAAHKSQSISRSLLKAQGNWLLFLPPYSPDLNPDRDGLLQAQGPPPTSQGPHLEDLWRAVGNICDLFERIRPVSLALTAILAASSRGPDRRYG
jgi:hypothetical protein